MKPQKGSKGDLSAFAAAGASKRLVEEGLVIRCLSALKIRGH